MIFTYSQIVAPFWSGRSAGAPAAGDPFGGLRWTCDLRRFGGQDVGWVVQPEALHVANEEPTSERSTKVTTCFVTSRFTPFIPDTVPECIKGCVGSVQILSTSPVTKVSWCHDPQPTAM